jgi:hypothetical protein
MSEGAQNSPNDDTRTSRPPVSRAGSEGFCLDTPAVSPQNLR